MIKKELKTNFKTMIIWTSICTILFGFVFALYPTIVDNLNGHSFDELLKSFPKEMLVAFNMDISDMDSAFGYFKTEGGTFLYLILGMFAGVLGTNALLKEKSEGTIEYLASKPIKRSSIINNKVLIGLFYIVVSVLIITLFNFIGFEIMGNYNKKVLFLISLSILQMSIPTYFICMLLSLLFKNSKSTTFISVGLIILSYFLSAFSSMSSSVKGLKYISLFTLSNMRYIIENGSLYYNGLFASIIISVVCYILIHIFYNKKELVN